MNMDPKTGWQPGDSIRYIRSGGPAPELPTYSGERYEDLVPDTLDLAERAELGINALTAPTDPRADYELYWFVDFFRNPPIMVHQGAETDVMQWAKFMEALPLLRLICGSDTNRHVDRAWMANLMRMIGPDGLVYVPLEGRPWAREGYFKFVDPVWGSAGERTTLTDESVTQYALPTICGRLIGAMTIYHLLDRSPRWPQIIEPMIDRLLQLTIDRGDFCYFPHGSFQPNAVVDPDAEMPVEFLSGSIACGRTIQGLAQYHRAVGYGPASVLAAKLSKQVKDHSGFFDAEGRFVFDSRRRKRFTGASDLGGHFHAHTIALLSMLEHALTVDDRELIEFVRRSYEWARTQGSSLVGFFPENIAPFYPTSEICEVADMLALAVKLNEAGAGDYWDDVDRWIRNQFAENQLTKSDWIDRIHRPQRGPRPTPYETDERVGERNVGAFAGWSSASDWAIRDGIMHCCTGNGARAIYYVWEHILDHEDGRLRVNLLLNRASPWADVHSYIPYEGRVDMRIKQPCEDVLIRVPAWIQGDSPEVVCWVNESVRDSKWQGRYLSLGGANAGDAIAVTFPIEERTVREFVGDAIYTLVIRGNSVVAVDPPGAHGPLYQRAHYREGKTRWRRIERFVPSRQVYW